MIRITGALKGVISLIVALLLLLTTSTSAKNVMASISFTISNPVFNSNNEIEVEASISGLIKSSCSVDGCYLQGRFQSAGGYFGYTYNNSGEFIDYFSPGSAEEIKSTLFNFIPVDGAWNGKLRIKNNPKSVYYYGPGDYPLSFRRFSGNSSNPTSGESNQLAIDLSDSLPDPSPNPTVFVSTPTPEPLTLKTQVPAAIFTPTPIPSTKSISTIVPKATVNVDPILGASDSADISLVSQSAVIHPDVPNEDNNTDLEKPRKFPWIGLVLIFIGISCVATAGYMVYKKQKTDSSDTISE